MDGFAATVQPMVDMGVLEVNPAMEPKNTLKHLACSSA